MLSLLRSGKCFWLDEAKIQPIRSTTQIWTDMVSDLSLVWNFFARSSSYLAVVWWRREVSAVFSGHGELNTLTVPLSFWQRPFSLSYLISYIYAFRFNCVATVKLLIQRGANPAIASTNRSTALHFAARRGNHKVAELLLDHAKVDINEKDFAHMTALHLACVSGNIAISKMLLGRGADITAKSTELMTPLHTAVYHGNAGVAALILRTGRYSGQA